MSKNNQTGLFKTLVASTCGLACWWSPSAAFANAERVAWQLNNAGNDNGRRGQARGFHRQERLFQIQPIKLNRNNDRGNPSAPPIHFDGNNIRERGGNRSHHHVSIPHTNPLNDRQSNEAIILPGQVSPFLTSRPSSAKAGRSTYINDAGAAKTLRRGLDLDLSSTSSNITVGKNVLGDSSVSITVGGQEKQINSGSKVTAAEFVALNQKLAGGSQGLSLSSDGSASGGSFDLNLVSDDGRAIKTPQLVVPTGVSVVGDFTKNADGVRVNGDLVNYGSVYAVSTSTDVTTAVIGARNIDNKAGAVITTDIPTFEVPTSGLNLSLKADRDLTNAGSITSAGDLELSAGRSLNNMGAASLIQARGDVSLNSSNITNQGSIISLNQNVNLSSSGDLSVINSGGNISALQGAINVRSADYTGTGVSTIYGGDLLSKELNLNAGKGVANVNVNELTGRVNSVGEAVHVKADTETLIIGTQCLTGDPTYYNTTDINLDGDITVQQDLAIIAGENIFTNLGAGEDLDITARNGAGQGFNIFIIAGANVTPGSGETPDPLPPQPPVTGNTNGNVTFSGPSANGGDVDLTGPDAVNINANSTVGDRNGGNVVIAAFDDGTNFSGDIGLPGGTINASGSGTGNNGNVTIIAGTQVGGFFDINNIVNDGGTGTAPGTGNVTIINAQPTTSDGQPITFNTSGAITTGNTIVASAPDPIFENTITVGSISAGRDVTIGGGDLDLSNDITAGGRVMMTSQGTTGDITFAGAISAPGGILMVANGSISSSTAVNNPGLDSSAVGGDAGNLTVIAGAAFTINANNVTITGDSGLAGSINFDQVGNEINEITARSLSGGGDAGDINFIAFDQIAINPVVAVNILDDGNLTGANGNFVAVAPNGVALSGINMLNGAEGTGAVTIRTADPLNGSVVIDTTNANFGGIASGNFLSGLMQPGDIATGGNIVVKGGIVGIFSGQNVDLANISVGNGATNAGIIDIVAEGTATLNIGGAGPNRTGVLSASATGPGNAGFIGVLNIGTQGISVDGLNFPVLTVTNGDGGDLILDADIGALTLNSSTISVNGAGASGNGGTITVSGDSIAAGANPIVLTANGAGTGFGGTIFVQTTDISAGGNITIGNDPGEFALSATGTNGSITVQAGGSVIVDPANVFTAPNLTLQSDFNDLAAGIFVVGNITGSNSVQLTATGAGGISGAGFVSGGNLFINTGTGSANLNTVVTSLTGTTAGGNIVLAEGDGLIINNTDLASGSLILNSNLGGNFVVAGNVTAGLITITTFGPGTMSGAGLLDTPGMLTLNAGTGNVVLNTSAAQLTVNSTGLVDLNQMTRVLVIQGVTANDFRIDSDNSIVVNAAINSSPVTILSQGSIDLNGNLNSNEGILIVSGQSIGTNIVGLNINGTNNTGDGGNIVLIAGTDYTNNGPNVTLNGASATGGNIDFTNGGGSLAQLSSVSTFGGGTGGDVTLLAYANGAGTGQVVLSPVTITSGGNGAANGDVAIIGSSSDGAGALVMGNIDTTGGTQGTGEILIQGAIPSASVGGIEKSDASYIGSFFSSNLTDGDITAGNLTNNGAILRVISNGNVGTGTVNTSGTAGDTNGGLVNLLSGSSTSVTSGDISSNGFGNGDGGIVTVNAGTGGLFIGNIFANGGATGDGGNVSVLASSAVSFNFNPIQAMGGGTSGSGGSITALNFGAGGISVDSNDFLVTVAATGGDGGHITIDAAFGATDGVVTFSGPQILSVNAAPVAGTNNGTIDILASAITVSGGPGQLEIRAQGGQIAGSGGIDLTTTAGGMTTNGNDLLIATGGQIGLTLSNNSITTGGGGGDAGDASIAGFSLMAGSVNIDASTTNANTNGGNLTVATNTTLSIGNLTSSGNGTGSAGFITAAGANSLSVGDVMANGGASGSGGFVTLATTSSTALNAGSISSISGAIAGNAAFINVQNTGSGGIVLAGMVDASSATGNAGPITLDAGSDGAVDLTGAVGGNNVINATGGTDSNVTFIGNNVNVAGNLSISGNILTVNLGNASPGTANLLGNNSITTLNGQGGGTIQFSNGANFLLVGTVGATQSLVATTTNAVIGITLTQAVNTSGTLTLNTPRLATNQSITAASILIQNLGGDLTVVGAAPGQASLNGTVPAAGPPGSPSSPPSVRFVTADGANLFLSADMGLSGDVQMDNFFGTTTSLAGSLFHGTNNVTLNTSTWTQQPGGNITGNNFILNILAGGTIINPDGDVTLAGNITLNGADFAIVALNDINVVGNLTINLSNSIGNGGNLSLLAGFAWSPTGGGQQNTSAPFTLTGTSTGSINGGTLTINTSATGAGNDGGDVLAVANGGNVTLGDINTSSASGTAGNVDIIGETGITTGDINSGGGTSGGFVTMTVAESQAISLPGPIVVTNGTISGGVFTSGSFTTGDIATGDISAFRAGLIAPGGGNSIAPGNLTAQIIELSAVNGTINLTSNVLNAQMDTSGNGGTIFVTADNFVTIPAAPLILNATGIGTGSGGIINYSSSSTAIAVLGGAGSTLQLDAHGGAGSGGQIQVITGGDLTVNAGGINANGSDGDGASIDLLAGQVGTGTLRINDPAFLSQTDATGANADGGFLRLSAPVVSYTSPLALSATGNGTGNGGTVIYQSSADLTPTFVGAPAKAPKPPANILDIDATSGLSGGDGGSITVAVGGNLTVNPDDMTAGPQSAVGNWNGANYSLSAGSAAPKGGSLAVSGGLDSDPVGTGSAGAILLATQSTKDFVLNPSKTPKNGVLGTLSASGPNGLIFLSNTTGGISVSTNAALTAPTINLTAGGKGGIKAGNNVTITASSSLSMLANSGNIGGSKPLLVDTPTLRANTGGSVGLLNSAASVVLNDSSGGKLFSLQTNGALTLNDVTTTKGSILIENGIGLLQVSNGAHLNAANGALTLQNDNTNNGDIVIGMNAIVETSGKGRNVTIAIGPAPKKGTNPSPPAIAPANVTIANPGGTVFLGVDPTGIAGPAIAPNAVVTAKNADVIFNNGSANTAIHKITLQEGAVVTADPPSKGGASPTIFTMPLALQQDTVEIPAFNNAQPILPPITNGLQSINNAEINLTGFTESGPFYVGADASWLSKLSDSLYSSTPGFDYPMADLVSSAQNSEAGAVGALFVEAAFENGSGATHNLNGGSALYVSTTDKTIETSHGTVTLAAGSVALVMDSSDRLAVYAIDDRKNDSIVVSAHDKTFTLTPGHHLTVSKSSSSQFEEINPIELVQYRGLRKHKLDSGWSAWRSEFSIMSACYAVNPLRSLMCSKNTELTKTAKHIMKTTAVVSAIRPDMGDFVQYFKRQMTAMK